jgi:membrane protein YdbS with pleckstrin-like domain
MAGKIAERRISDKFFYGHYAGALLLGIAAAVGLFMVMPLLVPLALIPPAAVFTWSRLSRAANSYRLFPDRLEIESGIFDRKIENVELFRVRDVGLRQGMLGRMADFGDIYVHSTDSSTPDMHIRAIDAPRDFYEQVRELVSSSRAQNRTMIVEEGGIMPER